jgi:hypothetical protein
VKGCSERALRTVSFGFRNPQFKSAQRWASPPHAGSEICSDNSAFVDLYRVGRADQGSAVFDYQQNGGFFTIESSLGPFQTRWTPKGAASIYAYDSRHHVAEVRHANEFSDVDDPSALDFRNEAGDFVLVKVLGVEGGPRWGTPHPELSIQ